MSITTMEEFNRLETGTTVTVGADQHVWQVIDGGLTRDGFTVTADLFTGMIAGGTVRVGVPFQVGQLWERRGYYHYITSLTGDVVRCCIFEGEEAGYYVRSATVEGQSGYNLIEPADHPEWVRHISGLAVELAGKDDAASTLAERQQRQVDNLESRYNDLRALNIERMNALAVSLHGYMETEDLDGGSDLADIMREHEIALPEEEVEVTVTIDGVSEVFMDADDFDEIPGVDITGVSRNALVEWTREFIHRVSVPMGDCACEHVSSRTVRTHLNENNIDHYSFEHEVTCSNC